MLKPKVKETAVFIFLAYSSGSLSIELPNIIFIIADDLGYTDVGYMNQKEVITPNIDTFKEESMCFTNAYSAAPVSSPTRASILTGKYPAEVRITTHIPGIGIERYLELMKKNRRLIEAEFDFQLPKGILTIANIAKSKNYNTAFMGKWHLGGDGSMYGENGVVDASTHPEFFGFDINMGGCAYGQPASYFSPYKNATISDGEVGEYLTDRFGNEAVNYIEKYHPDKTNKPFFLYLSTYTVHTPYQVPNETVETNKGDKYFAMIQKLDENVGKVLRKIDESNIRDNTIVIFYSDNGGLKSNSPLRGKKGDLLEGGIRVPLLVRWPTKIAAGSICHQPVTSVDFFPTFAEMVGYTADKHHDVSGNSLVPLFSGNEKHFENRPIFWHFPHHRNQTNWAMGAAIREGDWKLIWLFEEDKVMLYNLKDDLSESMDLSLVNIDKKLDMLSKLKAWQLNVNAEMPRLNPEHP